LNDLRRRGQGELLLAGSISIRPHDVKSLTMITDEQPKKFPIRKAAIRVDNDYVAINDHDYILPVSAQVVTRVGGNLLKRNTWSRERRRDVPSVRAFCGVYFRVGTVRSINATL
jgi:hypothetical protein